MEETYFCSFCDILYKVNNSFLNYGEQIMCCPLCGNSFDLSYGMTNFSSYKGKNKMFNMIAYKGKQDSISYSNYENINEEKNSNIMTNKEEFKFDYKIVSVDSLGVDDFSEDQLENFISYLKDNINKVQLELTDNYKNVEISEQPKVNNFGYITVQITYLELFRKELLDLTNLLKNQLETKIKIILGFDIVLR